MSNPRRKPRQSAARWQSVIDRQLTSGLSAPQFCIQHDITYQSFMRWRKKLQSDPVEMASVDSHPDFVELTAPDSLPPVVTASPWHIELDLAPGVQLRIAR